MENLIHKLSKDYELLLLKERVATFHVYVLLVSVINVVNCRKHSCVCHTLRKMDYFNSDTSVVIWHNQRRSRCHEIIKGYFSIDFYSPPPGSLWVCCHLNFLSNSQTKTSSFSWAGAGKLLPFTWSHFTSDIDINTVIKCAKTAGLMWTSVTPGSHCLLEQCLSIAENVDV